MISFRVKKGFRLSISGEPSHNIEELKKPDRVALLPAKIPFVKPRLKVRVGDPVNVGTPLFEDKRNPDVIFLSPGGGKITEINFGARRAIEEIVIALDPEEAYEDFPTMGPSEIENIDNTALIQAIMKGGLWPLIRALPFRDIANPDVFPPSIIVTLNSREPFQPLPEVYLKNKIDEFEFGISILQKLSGTVYISTAPDDAFTLKELKRHLTHVPKGVYPANDPGVLNFYIKKTPEENRAWYIDGQDVLLLADLFKSGKYPIQKTLVVGGSLVNERKHILTRAGVPLRHLTRGRVKNMAGSRCIVGGVFTGHTGSEESYMGFYEKSLVVISEGGDKEFFGFARPGFNKPSRSRAFLSIFNRSDFPMDCNRHGEERACINCGSCTEVCPVDILPQFTYKCIMADEIEEALAHGMLDCVECGLCSYVCPSKIELSDILKNTKKAYYLEQI